MAGGRIFVAAIAALLMSAATAHAQTKMPNGNSPALLRTWPQAGVWQTFLARGKDQQLACGMLSHHQEGGRTTYFAGLRQLPDDLSINLGDIDKAGVSGDSIDLFIDGVPVGSFPITRRIDNESEFHAIAATVPKAETQRVMNLFSIAASIKLVTQGATFAFPFTGAAQSLLNMRNCNLELANLQPDASHRTN